MAMVLSGPCFIRRGSHAATYVAAGATETQMPHSSLIGGFSAALRPKG